MKKHNLIQIISLFFIIVITLITRTWKIDTLPPALFSDEVDAGYQAKTFNLFQSDYYGNHFPIHFHSFSDWRTSLYIYSVSISERITNNIELSTRLPSVFFGILSIYVFYKITNSKLSALLLALSPWAIHYSRTGFEVSGMILVLLLGINYWKIYVDSNRIIHLVLSIFFFCLSPYFYSTAKLFLPLIFLTIIIVWKNELASLKKAHLLIGITVVITLLSPMLFDTINGRSGFRFSYIGIFTEPHREQTTDTLRYEDVIIDHPNQIGIKTPAISYLVHNKYELVGERFIKNYVSAFATNFLAINGDDNVRHGFKTYGLIYLLDLFLVIYGIFISSRQISKTSKLFLALLFLAPIPFSLTRDSLSPHATRLILMLPSIIYFSAIGLTKLKYLVPVYLLCFLSFWHFYTIHYPQYSAREWHSGMKETILEVKKQHFNQVYFSNSYEPFLPFFTLYFPYYPSNNQPLTSHLVNFQNSYFDGTALDQKYFFGHINYSNLPNDPNILYVIPQDEYQSIGNKDNLNIISKISKRYLTAQEFYLVSRK